MGGVCSCSFGEEMNMVPVVPAVMVILFAHVSSNKDIKS